MGSVGVVEAPDAVSELRLDGVVALDAALGAPAVVVGRMPPAGHDVDLLVADRAAAAEALARAGFVGAGSRWAWFGADRAIAVELLGPRDLGLSPRGGRLVAGQARTRDGYVNVLRPAPAHALALLAIRAARAGSLDERRAAQLRALLQETPDLWTHTAREAGRLGRLAAPCVQALHDAWSDGRRLPLHVRARAVGPLALVRRRLPVRSGVVIALSGLDGSGKSTQSVRLQKTLDELGVGTEVVWTSLFANPRLGALATPVKRVLGRVRRPSAAAPAQLETWSETAPTKPPDALTYVRRGSPAITAVWTAVAVFLQARWQRRDARRAFARGAVVVADRWWLDSHVHLRYEYGHRRRFRAQMAIMRRISPRPALVVLLRCPAEVAHERKGEYTLEQCRLRERLYDEEAPRHGAVVLDATAPPEDLARTISAAAWRAVVAKRTF